MKKLDPVIVLLTGLLIFFTIMLFLSERFFYQDAVLFAVISGVLGNASPALCSWGLGTFLASQRHPRPARVTRVTDQHTVQVDPKPE